MTVTGNRFVVLLRVSTQKQGADGLGVAAQRRDIQLFLDQHPEAKVLKELVEVEHLLHQGNHCLLWVECIYAGKLK